MSIDRGVGGSRRAEVLRVDHAIVVAVVIDRAARAVDARARRCSRALVMGVTDAVVVGVTLRRSSDRGSCNDCRGDRYRLLLRMTDPERKAQPRLHGSVRIAQRGSGDRVRDVIDDAVNAEREIVARRDAEADVATVAEVPHARLGRELVGVLVANAARADDDRVRAEAGRPGVPDVDGEHLHVAERAAERVLVVRRVALEHERREARA